MRPAPCLPARLQPLLEQLLEQFVAQYPGIEFPPLPERGSLSLEDIRNARYFFS